MPSIPARLIPFPAQYPGTCTACGNAIVPQQLILPSERSGNWQLYAHADCPPDPAVVQPGEVACSSCFLIHPAGECDR